VWGFYDALEADRLCQYIVKLYSSAENMLKSHINRHFVWQIDDIMYIALQCST